MAGSIFGTHFRIETFGESHGEGLGVVIDGCPAGLSLCAEDIQLYLNRRKPGQSKFATPRKEADAVEILSGVFEGKQPERRSHFWSEIHPSGLPIIPKSPLITDRGMRISLLMPNTASATIAAVVVPPDVKRSVVWQQVRSPVKYCRSLVLRSAPIQKRSVLSKLPWNNLTRMLF